MILIITNKLDPHADAVIRHLLKVKGVSLVRFNTEDFPQKVTFTWKAAGSLFDGILNFPLNRKISLSRISSCWYRRPIAPVVSSDLITEQARAFAKEESDFFLKGLWAYLSHCFWINGPFRIRQAESKMANLKLAAEIGFSIPRTLITNNPQEATDFFHDCEGNVINKVLGKGQVEYLKDYYFVYTYRVLPQDLEKMKDVAYCPSFFQEYISKKVEIRVTVVGNKVFSCQIHSQESEKTKDDWRHYDLENVKHVVHKLPLSIKALCLKMMERLDLNFATFDLILKPDNQYVFLELNPNGQWLWIEHLTGLPISQAIAKLLINQGQENEK